MAQPPDLAFHVVSTEEMTSLVQKHDVEAKLLKCAQRRTPEEQDVYHEQFCCTKDHILFTDADTQQEVALILEQVFRNPAKGVTRVFTELRIGNDVYKLRIP